MKQITQIFLEGDSPNLGNLKNEKKNTTFKIYI